MGSNGEKMTKWMHLGIQLNVLLIQLAFVLNQSEMNFKFSHKVKTTIIG